MGDPSLQLDEPLQEPITPEPAAPPTARVLNMQIDGKTVPVNWSEERLPTPDEANAIVAKYREINPLPKPPAALGPAGYDPTIATKPLFSSPAYRAVTEAAVGAGYDPHLVNAIIDRESSHNRKSQSTAGYYGLAQLGPDEVRKTGTDWNAYKAMDERGQMAVAIKHWKSLGITPEMGIRGFALAQAAPGYLHVQGDPIIDYSKEKRLRDAAKARGFPNANALVAAQNKGWVGPDGQIRPSSITAFYEKGLRLDPGKPKPKRTKTKVSVTSNNPVIAAEQRAAIRMQNAPEPPADWLPKILPSGPDTAKAARDKRWEERANEQSGRPGKPTIARDLPAENAAAWEKEPFTEQAFQHAINQGFSVVAPKSGDGPGIRISTAMARVRKIPGQGEIKANVNPSQAEDIQMWRDFHAGDPGLAAERKRGPRAITLDETVQQFATGFGVAYEKATGLTREDAPYAYGALDFLGGLYAAAPMAVRSAKYAKDNPGEAVLDIPRVLGNAVTALNFADPNISGPERFTRALNAAFALEGIKGGVVKIAKLVRDPVLMGKLAEKVGWKAKPVDIMKLVEEENARRLAGPQPSENFQIRSRPKVKVETPTIPVPEPVDIPAPKVAEPPLPEPKMTPVPAGTLATSATAEGLPAHSEWVDPKTIAIHDDIQYKSGVDPKTKTTGEYKGVDTFDIDQGGSLLVWEAADGTRYVVNGHHRLDIANRAKRFISTRMSPGGATEVPRKIAIDVIKESEGWTMEKARAQGALENIRDNKGNALDGVRVMQDLGLTKDQLAGLGTTFKSKLGRNIDGLMGLSKDSMDAVYGRKVNEDVGAGIGSVGLTPSQQAVVFRMEKVGDLRTFDEGAALAKDTKTSLYNREVAGSQGGMFDDDVAYQEEVSSLVDQTLIRTNIRSSVLRERSDLGKVPSELLTGEHIDAKARAELAKEFGETSKHAKDAIDLVLEKDPVIGPRFKEWARKVNDGKATVEQATADLIPEVKAELRKGDFDRYFRARKDVPADQQPHGPEAGAPGPTQGGDGVAETVNPPYKGEAQPAVAEPAKGPEALRQTIREHLDSGSAFGLERIAEEHGVSIEEAKAIHDAEATSAPEITLQGRLEQAEASIKAMLKGSGRKRKTGGATNIPGQIVGHLALFAIKAAKAAVSFATWAGAMVGRFGAPIKKFLSKAWDNALMARDEINNMIGGAMSTTKRLMPDVAQAAREFMGSDSQGRAIWNNAKVYIDRIADRDFVIGGKIVKGGKDFFDNVLYPTLAQDRLYGIRIFASEAQAELAQIWGQAHKAGDWQSNVVDLWNKSKARGLVHAAGGGDVVETLLESGQTADAFQTAIDTLSGVIKMENNIMTQAEFNANINHPAWEKALEFYKDHVEPKLKENHDRWGGVQTVRLGKLDTYAPLVRDTGATATGGKSAVFRSPTNLANKMATGTSHYTIDPEQVSSTVVQRTKGSARAHLINMLNSRGLVQKATGAFGTPNPQMTIGGKSYNTVRVKAGESVPFRIITQNGQALHVAGADANIPEFLHKEIGQFVDRNSQPFELKQNPINKTWDFLASMKIVGVTEPIAHGLNTAGYASSSQPLLGSSFSGKVIKNLPATLIPGWKNLMTFADRAAIDATHPQFYEDVVDLARRGLLPTRAGKILGGGPKGLKYGPKNLVFGETGLDVRNRVALLRYAKENMRINPDTPAGSRRLYDFVSGAGTYTYGLDSALERGLKSSRFSPFVTAAKSKLIGGVKAVLGTSPLPQSGMAVLPARLMQIVTGGGVAYVASWYAANRAFGNDPSKVKLGDIPIPDDVPIVGGRTLKMGFFSPYTNAGIVDSGVKAYSDAVRSGKTPEQARQDLTAAWINAGLKPVSGSPAANTAMESVGLAPYVTSDLEFLQVGKDKGFSVANFENALMSSIPFGDAAKETGIIPEADWIEKSRAEESPWDRLASGLLHVFTPGAFRPSGKQISEMRLKSLSERDAAFKKGEGPPLSSAEASELAKLKADEADAAPATKAKKRPLTQTDQILKSQHRTQSGAKRKAKAKVERGSRLGGGLGGKLGSGL